MLNMTNKINYLNQRIMLKIMDKLQAKNSVCLGKRLRYYFRALEYLMSLEEDSKIAFYENKEYKEITRDEAIQYILKKIKL